MITFELFVSTLRDKKLGAFRTRKNALCTMRQTAAAHLGSSQKTSPRSPTTYTAHICPNYLVAVSVWFEGAFNFHANVVCLFLGKRRELSTKGWQMQSSNLLIKFLREQIHLVFVALVLLPIL